LNNTVNAKHAWKLLPSAFRGRGFGEGVVVVVAVVVVVVLLSIMTLIVQLSA